jgi:hypothetical protein
MKKIKSILAIVIVLVIGVCLTGCVSNNFDDYFTDVSYKDGDVSMTITEHTSRNTLFWDSIPEVYAYVGDKKFKSKKMETESSQLGSVFIAHFEDLTEKPDRIVIIFPFSEDKSVEVTKELN